MSSTFVKVLLVIAGLVWGSWFHSAYALSTESLFDSDVSMNAQFGFAGHWKLGHVCPVRVDVTGLVSPAEPLTLELTTLDGDGVEVTYRKAIQHDQLPTVDGEKISVWLTIRQGRQSVAITIRLMDDQHALAVLNLGADEVPPPLPSSQPLVLALGDSMGVEAAAATLVSGSTTFTTAVISKAEDLPVDWPQYSACDLLLLSTSNVELLQSITAVQWTAINAWVRDGGVCLNSVGPAARALEEIDGFQSLLPGSILDVGTVRNPGPMESYVVTDDPLGEFQVVIFDAVRGIADLTLTDGLNRRVPFLSRTAYGFGIVYTVAGDLSQPTFVNWRDRSKLWKLMLNRFIDQHVSERAVEKTQVGSSSYLGYDDLVGQLRATLDVFPTIPTVSFGLVSALLVALLIVIGPVDYYISVKWLKRPDFSWYFAGTVLAAASLGLAVLRSRLRPEEVRINTVQIVDIDTESKRSTGHLWSHVYSSRARLLDIDVRTAAENTVAVIDWQGLPGRGLGGLMSQLNTDRGMPGYVIEHNADGQSQLIQVGIPAAGTKCLASTWHASVNLDGQASLKEIAGIDQLQGAVVNPLSVDLKDCMLMYHNWYYSMPSRIMPGQSIPISFETIPKDLPRRLNGRRIADKSEHTIPWDPADRNSLPRLLELMMFYKAASGPSYTTLLHRFQPQTDFSNLLSLDRAILVGRIDVPLATVSVSGESEFPVEQDVNQIWCRLVFPVEQNKK